MECEGALNRCPTVGSRPTCPARWPHIPQVPSGATPERRPRAVRLPRCPCGAALPKALKRLRARTGCFQRLCVGLTRNRQCLLQQAPAISYDPNGVHARILASPAPSEPRSTSRRTISASVDRSTPSSHTASSGSSPPVHRRRGGCPKFAEAESMIVGKRTHLKTIQRIVAALIWRLRSSPQCQEHFDRTYPVSPTRWSTLSRFSLWVL
jgi:hypothetical protein